MAGAKGRSGGARAGAGRKPIRASAVPSEASKAVPGEPLDPRPTLELVALGQLEVSPLQMRALTALLPYVHTKKGEGGKKEGQAEKAKSVARRFAAVAPPKLVAAGGKAL